jgi:hypothetical protein
MRQRSDGSFIQPRELSPQLSLHARFLIGLARLGLFHQGLLHEVLSPPGTRILTYVLKKRCPCQIPDDSQKDLDNKTVPRLCHDHGDRKDLEGEGLA